MYSFFLNFHSEKKTNAKSTFSTMSLFISLLLIHSVDAANVKSRMVESIVITETGRSLDDSEKEIESCKAFQPGKSEIEQFFLKSYPVPAKLGAHDRYSPCYANGSIEFSDNTRGKWKIASSGTGTLRWDTGDVVTLFYPHYRWHDPFSGTYDTDEEMDFQPFFMIAIYASSRRRNVVHL